MKRIVFTGAQGTGKTTLLNLYRDKFDIVITEVVRNLAKEGVKVNELGDCEGQERIYNEYLKLLSNKNSYISDRCLVDVFAYSLYLYDNARPDLKDAFSEIVTKQSKKLREFFKLNPDIIICYVPIEFRVENDGFRSTNEDFRREIDSNIKFILFDYLKHENTFTIFGDIENRTKLVDKILE